MDMNSRLLHDPLAHWLLGAAAVAIVLGEVAATYLGRAGDRERRPGAVSKDRGTRVIIVVSAYAGLTAALAIARVPGLRAYADNWWTLGLGIAVALAGSALRDWAIVSLGRYFRRSVTIEPGQTLVRRCRASGSRNAHSRRRWATTMSSTRRAPRG